MNVDLHRDAVSDDIPTDGLMSVLRTCHPRRELQAHGRVQGARGDRDHDRVVPKRPQVVQADAPQRGTCGAGCPGLCTGAAVSIVGVRLASMNVAGTSDMKIGCVCATGWHVRDEDANVRRA